MLEVNWQRQKCREIELEGHSNFVTCLQIYDNHLVSGSRDTTIKLWELNSGELIRTFESHTEVLCLSFDGRKIVSGGSDGTLKIWNWQTGICVLTLSAHKEEVSALDVAGNVIASGSERGELKVWSLEDKEVFTLIGRGSYTNKNFSVKLDAASRTLLIGTYWSLLLWDLDTRKAIRTGKHTKVVQTAFISRKAETSIAWNRGAKPSKALSARALRAQYGKGFVTQPERPLPPRYVITGSSGCHLRVFCTASRVCVRMNFCEQTGVKAPATRRVITGGRWWNCYGGGIVKTWDIATGNYGRKSLRNFTHDVTCAAMDHSFVAAGDGCRVMVYRYRYKP